MQKNAHEIAAILHSSDSFFEFSPGGINPHLNLYISESPRGRQPFSACTERERTEVHNREQKETAPADNEATHPRPPWPRPGDGLARTRRRRGTVA
jgi:hypothetical protein